METWAKIPNAEGYEVSNLGNVRSYRIRKSGLLSDTPKPIKPQKLKTHCKEYYKISLMVKGEIKRVFIHRLVALAFLENALNKPQVNHKDNNGLNNNLSNLEWCTNSENQIHRFNQAGRYSVLGLYIHKNREYSFRVEKKGVINKCFKTLEEAKLEAQKYY